MASNGIVGATIWSSIQRFGGLAISFISNMVLARLLGPDDFGTMGLIMVFITVADVLVDGGLGNALIQKKSLEEKDKTTIFTANLFFSVFLFGFLFLIAPAVETFTEVKGFSLLLRVQSVCVLIRAFYVVNVSQITRALNYPKLAKITLASQFTSTAVSIRRIRKETASDSASPSPKNKKFTFLPGVRDSLPRGSRIFRIRLFPGPEQVSGERSGQPDGPADGQHPPRKLGRASQNTAPPFGVVFRRKLPIIGDCRFFGLPLPLCSELCGARRNIY